MRFAALTVMPVHGAAMASCKGLHMTGQEAKSARFDGCWLTTHGMLVWLRGFHFCRQMEEWNQALWKPGPAADAEPSPTCKGSFVASIDISAPHQSGANGCTGCTTQSVKRALRPTSVRREQGPQGRCAWWTVPLRACLFPHSCMPLSWPQEA